MLRALPSTAACAVLASATCAIARPRQPGRNTVHSRLMSPDTHIDLKYLPHLPGNEWRMRAAAAISAWPSIRCPAGDALHRREAGGAATRGVFIRILNAKTAANVRRVLRDLARACPALIHTILADRAGCVQSKSRCTPSAFASAIAASECNGNVLVQ
jgi:hypothetical protein